MSCNYCQKQERIPHAFLKISINHDLKENNYLEIDYDAYSCDSSFEEIIYINYCPICGRKL